MCRLMIDENIFIVNASNEKIDGKLIGIAYLNNNQKAKINSLEYFIICDECKKKILFKNNITCGIKQQLIKKEFYCKKCKYKGIRNPFYGKHHSEKSKEKYKKTRKETPWEGSNQYLKAKEEGRIYITSEEHKQKNRNSHLKEKNHFYGKTHIEESRKKMSDKHKQNWINKSDVQKEEWKQKLKIGQKNAKEKDPVYYNNLKRAAGKISNALQTRYHKTKIEEIFEQILINNNIEYEYSFILNSLYQYDFIIKNTNILIEVDGDYWHGNPNIYKELNHIQIDKQEKDKIKEEYAKQYGYKVIRIWEQELKNINKINEVLNEIRIS